MKQEEIYTLIVSDLIGEISKEEKELLSTLVDNNQEIYALYHDMKAVLESEDAVLARKNIRTAPPLKLTSRQNTWSVVFRYAAFVILTLGIGYFFLIDKKQQINISKTQSLPVKEVQLSLPDGRKITLDSSTRLITSNQVSLKNSHNTLSFAGGNTHANTSQATLFIPVGRFHKMELSDGTKVMLNATTKITFPLQFNETREIWIDGEAFLDVAAVADHPFIVHTPKNTIEVLGTSFNVNTYDNKERVSLVNGKVKIITSQKSIVLNPGEEFTSTDNNIGVRMFDQQLTLSWRNGVYLFDTTLSEIAKVIPHWYGMNVVADDKLQSKRFFGGIDRDQPITTFLEQLTMTTKLKYVIKGEIIYITN